MHCLGETGDRLGWCLWRVTERITWGNMERLGGGAETLDEAGDHEQRVLMLTTW